MPSIYLSFSKFPRLSSYVLISLGRDKRALTGAFNYLIMGTIGATFYVIGVGMLYMMTGTLNMADLAHVCQNFCIFGSSKQPLPSCLWA